MNNFELFKLKAAGLTNLNILNILDYQKTQDRKLSLRDMAVVSKSKNAVLFMEKYKTLDIKQLKEQYQRYPTVSIFDQDYPIELKHTYNPPVLLFYQGNIELLSQGSALKQENSRFVRLLMNSVIILLSLVAWRVALIPVPIWKL